jgi:phosphoglycolate phosphatase-like HAD superfamily hydrolase
VKKPILATTLSGLLIKSDAWNKAHILWYENAAKKLNDETIKKWIRKENYFEGVDEVMKRLYPSLSEEKRTKKARELFFNSVIENIQKTSSLRNSEVINYFCNLKKKYQLALITTNTSAALKKILAASSLKNFFDLIETSLPEEKDDKRKVFDRFIQKHGKPIIYLGGNRKDSFDYCKKNGIRSIFTNLENQKEIEGIKSIHNLGELKEVIESL